MSNVLPEPAAQRTSHSSFIRGPFDGDAPWFDLPSSSFVVRAPTRPKRPRRRRIAARTPVKPDPWQPMAGRLELVADVARQCARAARSRDPKTFDRLMDAVREALLDAIAAHNTDEALQ